MLSVIMVSAAEEPYYKTQTIYDSGTPDKVRIVSTVYGVDEDDQITYLAYNQEILSEDEEEGPFADGTNHNIVYIDQDQADDSGIVEFDYVANIADIGTTVIKFGAGTTTGIEPELENKDDLLKTYEVTVDFDGVQHGEVDNVAYVLSGGDCTFIITPDDEYSVNSIVVNDGDPVDLSRIITGNDGTVYFTVENILANTTLTVEFKEDVGPVDPAIKAAANFPDPVENFGGYDQERNNVTVFSNVTIPKSYPNADYGILFSYESGAEFKDIDFGGDGKLTDNAVGVLSEGSGTKKFKALGKGLNGSFAVQLIDNADNEMLSGTYYIRTYLVAEGYDGNGDPIGEVVYGGQIEF